MQLRPEGRGGGSRTREVSAGRLEAGSYYGSVRGVFATPLARVCCVSHDRGRALPEHDHALAYFCMLLEGSYTESVAGRSIDYAPFQASFHPACMPHRDAVGARGACFLCVELEAAPLEEAGVRLRADAAPLAGDVSMSLLRVHRALARRTLSDLELEGAVWDLCGALGRGLSNAERGTPAWLGRVLEIVEEEHGEALTVASIARRVGVHPVHASREFRRRYRQTIGEYLNKVRIRSACARISRGGESLAQVAHASGFADHAHFCRVFKSAVGCTPSEFALLRYSM